MSGQTMKSKDQIVDEFIKRVNPYESHQPIAFDLRGYAAYMEEHNLQGKDITPEIMNKFSRASVENSSASMA